MTAIALIPYKPFIYFTLLFVFSFIATCSFQALFPKELFFKTSIPPALLCPFSTVVRHIRQHFILACQLPAPPLSPRREQLLVNSITASLPKFLLLLGFHSLVCFLRLSSFILKTVKQDFWHILQIHNDRVVFCVSTAVTNTYYSTHTSVFPAKCKRLFKKVPRFRVQLTLSSIKTTDHIATVLFLFSQTEILH